MCMFAVLVVRILRSSAYVRLLHMVDSWCSGGTVPNWYPLAPTCSHLSSGSMYMRNRKGDSVSPCKVPLSTGTAPVFPCNVLYDVVALVYMSFTTSIASVGKPRSYRICSVRSWSVMLKADEKSTCIVYMSWAVILASSIAITSICSCLCVL